MKVTSSYLEYLLAKKKLQTLEKELQAIAERMGDLKQSLRELEQLPSLVSQEGVFGSKIYRFGGGKRQGRPWGNYIMLLLIALFLIGTSLLL